MLTKHVAAIRLVAAILAVLRGREPGGFAGPERSERPRPRPQVVSASRAPRSPKPWRASRPSVVTVQTEVVERVPVDPFESMIGGRSGEQTSARASAPDSSSDATA